MARSIVESELTPAKFRSRRNRAAKLLGSKVAVARRLHLAPLTLRQYCSGRVRIPARVAEQLAYLIADVEGRIAPDPTEKRPA